MTIAGTSNAVNDASPTPVVVSPTPRRGPWVVGTLAVLLALSCVAAFGFGPYRVPTGDVVAVVWARLSGGTADVPAAHDAIVWDLRAPRVLTGALVGATLAVAGAALQAVVRNTLADPYLLGVSSGASLGAAIVLTLGLGSVVGALTLAAGAFVGAMVAVALVLALMSSRRQLSSNRLVLAGITVSYFLSAVTNLVVVFADSRDAVRAVMFWTLGSLSRSDWPAVPVLAAAALTSTGLLLLWSRRLDAISLGDDVARSLGSDPGRLRARVAVVSSVGVASAVAVSGSIGFVGLVVPHLARRLVGATHRLVLPVSALVGAVILVWADTLARSVLAPREIPLGILTALLGTPLLMLLVRRQLARSASA